MALALVSQLRDLAAVEENRYFIVRDQGCLPAIVPHLGSKEDEVVVVALEALHYLSLYPGNRSPVCLAFFPLLLSPYLSFYLGLVSLRNL